MVLEFRPHHFLCTLGFEGMGYSDAFIRNFQKIVDDLRDDTLIRVSYSTDAICAPCPNRQGSVCATEPKIQKLDQSHAAILGLQPGDSLTWAEAKNRLRKHMTVEAFESACAPCSWKSFGVCKAALDRLKLGRTAQ